MRGACELLLRQCFGSGMASGINDRIAPPWGAHGFPKGKCSLEQERWGNNPAALGSGHRPGIARGLCLLCERSPGNPSQVQF